MNDGIKKDNKKIIIISTICILLVAAIIGSTYSFLVAEDTDNKTITANVIASELSVEVNQVAPTNTNRGLIPQMDELIPDAIVGTKGNCVDYKDDIICQVYEIKVKNKSDIEVDLDGLIRLNAQNTPNLKWALIDSYTTNINTTPTLITSVNKHQITTITSNEHYEANETKTYYMVVWISETGEKQTDTSNYTGTITFKLSDKNEAANTLYALNIAPNTEIPDFTKTSCSSGCQENTVGVYSLEDDLGTSYYFRGDIENNYVKFADLYWRIVRINGDGTIRITYDGTTPHKNEDQTSDRAIINIKYNEQYMDNSFVGYMNGTVDGINFPNGTTNSTSYAEARANKYNSTVKTYLEGAQNETNTGWYYDNIESKNYSSYIADAIYCNDREIYSGEGYGQNTTLYKIMANITSSTPNVEFKCENELDRFTKGDMVGNIKGNSQLRYPIALLTTEELMTAGIQTENRKTYLSVDLIINDIIYEPITMTPVRYRTSSNGKTEGITIGGYNPKTGAIAPVKTIGVLAIKPVISLKTNILNYGDGTIDNPFRIAE